MPERSLTYLVWSIAMFVIAGPLEIGGGWLMWKWLREHWAKGWGILGAAILTLYGVIPTLQQAHFGRIYAVYGGFFISLSLLWGWAFDGNRPDRWDIVGASVAIPDVACMMYAPR